MAIAYLSIMERMTSRFGAIGLFMTLVSPLLSASISSKIVLTNKFNGLESTPEFSCTDTVHGYLTLPEKAVGDHTLEGVWILPNNQIINHSKNIVEFGPAGGQTAYVGLAFQDKSQGSLGDFREGRSDVADGANPYNGMWQLRVLWDGRPLIQTKFKMKCS